MREKERERERERERETDTSPILGVDMKKSYNWRLLGSELVLNLLLNPRDFKD